MLSLDQTRFHMGTKYNIISFLDNVRPRGVLYSFTVIVKIYLFILLLNYFLNLCLNLRLS